MIFQDPASALNPVYTIGEQIVETIVTHTSRGRAARARDAVELLGRVGIPSPRSARSAYPARAQRRHAPARDDRARDRLPPLLILADEPTTNLDVTIQDQILHLLADLRAEREMAMILVSHDLGVVSQTADSGRGDVRRPHRRGGADRAISSRAAHHPVHARRCSRRSPDRRAGRRARSARPDRAASRRSSTASRRLPVPAPLRVSAGRSATGRRWTPGAGRPAPPHGLPVRARAARR